MRRSHVELLWGDFILLMKHRCGRVLVSVSIHNFSAIKNVQAQTSQFVILQSAEMYDCENQSHTGSNLWPDH